jgi:hypothetical protein
MINTKIKNGLTPQISEKIRWKDLLIFKYKVLEAKILKPKDWEWIF